MINNDKLEQLPFREKFTKKNYKSSYHYYCGRLIAHTVVSKNVGKSIDKAYSEFRHNTKAPAECFYSLFATEHSTGFGYNVVEGKIVYNSCRRKYNNNKPVKSEYKSPKLIQARAERQQKKNHKERTIKQIAKSMKYDFIHISDKYKKEIKRLTKWYRRNTIESLKGYNIAIVAYYDGRCKPTVILDYVPINTYRKGYELIKILE